MIRIKLVTSTGNGVLGTYFLFNSFIEYRMIIAVPPIKKAHQLKVVRFSVKKRSRTICKNTDFLQGTAHKCFNWEPPILNADEAVKAVTMVSESNRVTIPPWQIPNTI